MMSRLALALLVALNVTPAWSMPRGSGAPPTVMRVNDFYSKFGWNTSLHNGSTVSEIETNLQTMLDKGLDPADRKMRTDFSRRFLVTLHDLRKAGAVEKIGNGRGVVWGLTQAMVAE